MAQPFAVSSVFLLFMIVLCGTPRRHEGPCSVSHASRPGCYLLCVQTKTAWDGKSTWINIYYGRCCSRQVLFRGNLPWPRRCYGNNPLTEVFLHSVWLQSSEKSSMLALATALLTLGIFKIKNENNRSSLILMCIFFSLVLTMIKEKFLARIIIIRNPTKY